MTGARALIVAAATTCVVLSATGAASAAATPRARVHVDGVIARVADPDCGGRPHARPYVDPGCRRAYIAYGGALVSTQPSWVSLQGTLDPGRARRDHRGRTGLHRLPRPALRDAAPVDPWPRQLRVALRRPDRRRGRADRVRAAGSPASRAPSRSASGGPARTPACWKRRGPACESPPTGLSEPSVRSVVSSDRTPGGHRALDRPHHRPRRPGRRRGRERRHRRRAARSGQQRGANPHVRRSPVPAPALRGPGNRPSRDDPLWRGLHQAVTASSAGTQEARRRDRRRASLRGGAGWPQCS